MVENRTALAVTSAAFCYTGISVFSCAFRMTHLTESQQAWLHETLTTVLDVLEQSTLNYDLTPLAGDASSRQYFSLIVADAPLVLVVAEHECNLRFAFMTHKFETSEARVPCILAMQARPEKIDGEEISCMLVSSVGNSDLLHALQQKKARTKMLYMQAITQIYQWQAIEGTEEAYDQAAFARESDLFIEWFVPHLADDKKALETAYAELVSTLFPLLCSQPYALSHRDYHSRNILINEQSNGRLYTVDYQDAIRAPVSYDLVSLLKDVYIDMGDALRKDMCKYFYERLPESHQQGLDNFVRDFELVGIQRHLKIAGIFTRLCVRDTKPAYLASIPLCLDYLQAACADAALPAANTFATLLEKERTHIVNAIETLQSAQ